jgi:release factor glutamine methyltransferase
VFAEDEAELLAAQASGPALERLVARRVAGEPLEQVLGWVAFDGHRFPVEPGVFVPRRRTQLLVREAAAAVSAVRDPVVVDLCCGCGAVGAALRLRLGRGTLVAADLDPAAVRCARRAVEPLGGQVAQGDLFDALPPALRGRVDVLVANVPYVPSDAVALMPPEARLHEPRLALDGGPDGLRLAARVAAGAPSWLAPGGAVLIETSAAQVPTATALFAHAGFRVRVVTDEDLEATAVTGTLDGRESHPRRAPRRGY